MWAADWKNTSYWLDDMPQVLGISSDLKRKVDVLIIGSGYTGLNAALEIARGGRYDGLLKSLGAKKNIPAVGAAINLKYI